VKEALEDKLVEAVSAYDYPAVTYDFVEGRERRFSGMNDLDYYLQCLLQTDDVRSLKDGLSAILYWGHYRAGYRDYRVAKFRGTVTDVQLQRAIGTFRILDGTGLISLKRAALPQFSNMAFITKLRTFLDPAHYCVLDSKIAKLAPLVTRLKCHRTYIPVNRQNELAYAWWVDTCFAIASSLRTKLRPVDVERGLFCLVEQRRIELAEELLLVGAGEATGSLPHSAVLFPET
jgi:hypothetical protein